MLDHIRIVLVNPSHPGNIGAAARAMKTMGLAQLFLVAPEKFPHPKANEMAVNAADIVTNAKVVTLQEAISDCTLVIGTSARMRTIPWPLLTPRQVAEKIHREKPTSQIAILFGREHSGLTNEELQLCHLHLTIPANPACSSLNIAAAVQVVCYELYAASLEQSLATGGWDRRLATVAEMEGFFLHLENVLVAVDFLKPNAPRKLMARLRRLFNRTRPDVMEVNILRGMLTAVLNAMKKREVSNDDL